MAQNVLPNQYDLRGQGVTISYSVTSITGKPQLSFKKGRQMLNFSGDEIGVFDTTIGSLVTVTMQGQSTEDSLPSALYFRPSSWRVLQLDRHSQTIGITTVHKTTIAGPIKGVQQSYRPTSAPFKLRSKGSPVCPVTCC